MNFDEQFPGLKTEIDAETDGIITTGPDENPSRLWKDSTLIEYCIDKRTLALILTKLEQSDTQEELLEKIATYRGKYGL
jgi:hypothetical protein